MPALSLGKQQHETKRIHTTIAMRQTNMKYSCSFLSLRKPAAHTLELNAVSSNHLDFGSVFLQLNTEEFFSYWIVSTLYSFFFLKYFATAPRSVCLGGIFEMLITRRGCVINSLKIPLLPSTDCAALPLRLASGQTIEPDKWNPMWNLSAVCPVSYTHLTLPTILLV